MKHPDLRFAEMSEARDAIQSADLLLYRRRGLISIAGRGQHSHAAKAAWWNEELFCLEVTGSCGGRAVTLASQVQRLPGRIDVYEANPDCRWPQYNRIGAVQVMSRFAGCNYGWLNLLAAALIHLPWVRLLVPANVDDRAIDRRPPFCSQAVAIADRLGGGVDPVPQLADRLTEPCDLARSQFYRYRFTLVP